MAHLAKSTQCLSISALHAPSGSGVTRIGLRSQQRENRTGSSTDRVHWIPGKVRQRDVTGENKVNESVLTALNECDLGHLCFCAYSSMRLP